MTAIVITLADHRVRERVKTLLSIQEQIDAAARTLLGKEGKSKPLDKSLEKLLDEMDVVLKELKTNSSWIERPDLRRAVVQTVAAHAKWARARLGSAEERDAAARYLESVDLLGQVAL